MSKLRDIFNKKMDQKQFELKPQNWQDLEKMLDRHDQKKIAYKKWLLSFVFLVIITSVFVWKYQPSESARQIAVNKVSENNYISETKATVKTEKNVNQFQNQTLITKKTSNYQAASIDNQSGLISRAKGFNGVPSEERTLIKSGSLSDKHESNKPVLTSEIESSVLTISNEITMEKGLPNSSENNAEVTGNSFNSKSSLEKSDEILNDENHQNFETNLSISVAFSDSLTNSINEVVEINSKQYNSASRNASSIHSNDSVSQTIARQIILRDTTRLDSVERKNTPNSESDFSTPVLANKNESKIKPVFSIGLYSGGTYVGKSIALNNQSGLEFFNRKKEEEGYKLSYNIGLDLNCRLGNWSLSSGINYHEQGEQTNYKPEFYKWIPETTMSIIDNSYWESTTKDFWILTDNNYLSYNDSIVVAWNENTQTFDSTLIAVQDYNYYDVDTVYFQIIDSSYVYVLDSIQFETGDSLHIKTSDPNVANLKTKTKLRYFEIPLLIGYYKNFDKISVGIKTGIGLGILTGTQIYYLNEDLSGISEVKSVNKFMYNYLLRPEINYLFSDKISLLIEPNLRINLNKAITTDLYSQKYWNVGLNMGITYTFK